MRLLLSGGDKPLVSVTADHYRPSIINEHSTSVYLGIVGKKQQKLQTSKPPHTHPFHAHKAHMQVLKVVPLLEREMVRKWLLHLQNKRKQKSCQPSHQNSWFLCILINSQLYARDHNFCI